MTEMGAGLVSSVEGQGATGDGPSWAEVRNAFDLAADWIHLGSSQYLASHPLSVGEAIERHRLLSTEIRSSPLMRTKTS